MFKNMKTTIYTLFLCLLPLLLSAQVDDRLAKLEYSEAEEAFEKGNHGQALNHLEKTKDLLGKTNQKIMYLEIMSLIGETDLDSHYSLKDFLFSETEKFENLYTIKALCRLYIDRFVDTAPLEKLKEINAVSNAYKEIVLPNEHTFLLQGVTAYKNKDYEAAEYALSESCTRGNEWACAMSENFVTPIINLLNNMVNIKGGTFTMGCPDGRDDCEKDEMPAHTVTLSDFQLSRYELTQVQYAAVMFNYHLGLRKSLFRSANSLFAPSSIAVKELPILHWKDWCATCSGDCMECPVTAMGFFKELEFFRILKEMTGLPFTYPTEAQWEYAASGGSLALETQYAGSNDLDEVAVWKTGELAPVGTKKPNELGLYDMNGNVAEFCLDRYDKNYYKKSPEKDPENWKVKRGKGIDVTTTVSRGGHYKLQSPLLFRVTKRNNATHYIGVSTGGKEIMGYRLALELNP